jgi:hypothetical protein
MANDEHVAQLKKGVDAWNAWREERTPKGRGRWLKPVIGYPSVDRLLDVLEDKIVRPAEAKFNELLARRTEQLRVENV